MVRTYASKLRWSLATRASPSTPSTRPRCGGAGSIATSRPSDSTTDRPTSASTPRSRSTGPPRCGPRGTCRTCRGTRPASSTSRSTDRDARVSVGAGGVHQPRAMPDGSIITVRDDTGWLNVWVGDRPLVDEPFEHAGPSWGMGQRSYAVSPDGGRVAFTRNERGFGRLCVADVRTGDVTEIARGVHGQLTWVGDRLAAIRSGARTPTQIVVYDTAAPHRHVGAARAGRRVPSSVGTPSSCRSRS